MSLSRFNIFEVFKDQLASMVGISTSKPDKLAQFLVIAVSPVMGTTSFFLPYRVQSPANLITMLTLFAGLFVAAFALIISVREQFGTYKNSDGSITEKRIKLVDESALTVLATGLVSGIDAIFVALVSTTIPAETPFGQLTTAITMGLTSLSIIYFLLSIRRLHILYRDSFN
jgi:hypothetical protein